MAHKIGEGSQVRKARGFEVVGGTDAERMREVRDAMWKAEKRRLAGLQKYNAYRSLLPSKVEFVGLPDVTTNCAGYALGLGRSTSEPYAHIKAGFVEVESSVGANIYVLHDQRRPAETEPEETWAHVGKILPDGRAESKWGTADPVFRHPVSYFPGEYTGIKYYRKIVEEDQLAS